ncbi:MAG: 4,5-DOPA dioxygenase extradiol [Hyphomicrobiales bacterium]
MMPVLFIGHGHPLNAIRRNDSTAALARTGQALPRPEAILVVSAHWLSRSGVAVSATEHPETIYDFGPFHPDLFRITYPAPGAPRHARRIAEPISAPTVRIDLRRGLDHGAWTVLMHLFPAAQIPVFQLSIDIALPPQYHYDLARRLLPVQSESIMVIGSGNIVHNLERVDWEDENAPAEDWARAFDETAKNLILTQRQDGLIHCEQLEFVRTAIPTNDHYLPMLYTLGVQQPGEAVQYLFEGFQYANISMRCFRIG